jgi:LysR family glycine cleavage system transcriptional activator
MINPYFFPANLASGRLVQLFDLIVQADKSYWLVYP